MSTATLLPAVAAALAEHGLSYEVLACDPDLADTAAFCDHYGFTLDQSANTILVTSKKWSRPNTRSAWCWEPPGWT